MRPFHWMSLAFAMSLGGCSLYPIPDDVSPFRTDEVVRYGRCEVREAIRAYLDFRKIAALAETEDEISNRIKAANDKAAADKNRKKKLLEELEEELLRIAEAAIVYSFDFNIIETNKAGADAGFRLPGLTNVLDVSGTAALDLTRQGSRVFSTEDTWGDLITDKNICKGTSLRPGNIVYPLSGSIGVGGVVKTFLDIGRQGGVKDTFVDTLTFTTLASGGANASFKLDPVPTQFRPISATAALSASRLDVHKMTVSLAFAHPPSGGISKVVRFDGDLNAPEGTPFERPAPWRARYNLCVQDARTREASLKQLRLEDPLVYCIYYADRFAPSYQNRRVAITEPRLIPGKPRTALTPATPDRIVPQTTFRKVRPNEGTLPIQ